jgi:hypothetical protein
MLALPTLAATAAVAAVAAAASSEIKGDSATQKRAVDSHDGARSAVRAMAAVSSIQARRALSTVRPATSIGGGFISPGAALCVFPCLSGTGLRCRRRRSTIVPICSIYTILAWAIEHCHDYFLSRIARQMKRRRSNMLDLIGIQLCECAQGDAT